jgi:gamma-glutamylcyclotransferase (GGCT)/AIG2-like uncharacterized protein YtfP
MPFDVLQLLLEVTAARRAGRRDASPAEHELEHRFACGAWLASYGSLAPGGKNHGELARCPGTWWQGTVTGHRAERQWPVFTFAERGPHVPVWLLHSRELPAQWSALDAFEGDEYRRILVPVWQGDQLFAVANLYEAVIPVTAAEAR